MLKLCRPSIVLALLSAAIFPLGARADWTQFSLPNLSYAFGPTALAHLPDGRYVFAQSGNFYRQDTWNNGAYSAYSGEPVTDPSFITVWDATTAAAGRGGWGASDIDTFDPSILSSPGFTSIGVSLQNYHGVFRDAGSLYTAGADTGTGGDRHGLRYVTLDGSVNKVIIDDVSAYSCGFDIDASGNLYVGDNDDGKVYLFTKAQLDGAIGGSALTVGDGTLIYDFGDGGDVGSLAVDGDGRLWAAGWMHNGLMVYNPALGQQYTYIPGLANANYKVAAFTRGGEQYIAYLNQEDPWSNDSAQYYGFDLAGNYAIPEPTSVVLLGAGLVVLLARTVARNAPGKRTET